MLGFIPIEGKWFEFHVAPGWVSVKV